MRRVPLPAHFWLAGRPGNQPTATCVWCGCGILAARKWHWWPGKQARCSSAWVVSACAAFARALSSASEACRSRDCEQIAGSDLELLCCKPKTLTYLCTGRHSRASQLKRAEMENPTPKSLLPLPLLKTPQERCNYRDPTMEEDMLPKKFSNYVHALQQLLSSMPKLRQRTCLGFIKP